MVFTTIQYIPITGEKLQLGRETKKANIFPRSYVIKSEAEFEFSKLQYRKVLTKTIHSLSWSIGTSSGLFQEEAAA